MKINKLDNPVFIFILAFFAILVNAISAVHFFPILLLGPLFMAFIVSLKRMNMYSLSFVLIAMLMIELNNGFMPLSLIMLAFFIYAFIIPYLKRILSFDNIKSYVYIFVFYLGVFVLWTVNNENSIQLSYTLIINIIIDFIVLGVFL